MYSFLVWTDATPSNERISELKPYQWINHFPGMGEICRKDSLARNMAKYDYLSVLALSDACRLIFFSYFIIKRLTLL